MLPGKVIPFSINPGSSSQVSETQLSVIQVGRDPDLLSLRSKLLSAAGYSVRSMTPEESTAEGKITSERTVWVFCHTVEFYELARIAVAIRRTWPGDKLLRITGLEDVRQAPGLFDELLQPIEGVEGLLLAVKTLSTT